MATAHMPEYESIKRTKEDLQLIYNAFLFLFNQGGWYVFYLSCSGLSSMSLVSLCCSAIARNIGNRALQNRISFCEMPGELQDKVDSCMSTCTNY